MIFTDFDAIPNGAFQFIMADPPWTFKTRGKDTGGKGADGHYGLMGHNSILSLPVAQKCADNAVLWLWATNPHLPLALRVLDAWGFSYSTAGTWVKRTKHGKLAFGTGYVLRGANEPFLIGRLGHPKTSKSIRSVIEGPVREHSRKPEEAFAAAEKMMPNARRLDLFSRQERPGWDAFGNEVGKFGT